GREYERHSVSELRSTVLRERRTGIEVWSEALDLRAAAPESPPAVFYLYTDRQGFRSVAGPAALSQPDAIAALSEPRGRFGRALRVSPLERAGRRPHLRRAPRRRAAGSWSCC
ncbi:unnamed protein product, partial [Prorocentrum cordatum]